jgi:SAM-dependent methyltransferase
MQEARPGGSAARWGPLFGARARDWAETWEGPTGWGTPAYEHVLDRANLGTGVSVLDCGCGAGRFARLAADLGASVGGIDAAEGLIEIAGERTPDGDFRVGDLEALPWPDDSFDVVPGFSSFQFADDKERAFAETRRVSRRTVAMVIPSRVSESGIASVFKPLFPLFAAEALESMKHSGMFALSPSPESSRRYSQPPASSSMTTPRSNVPSSLRLPMPQHEPSWALGRWPSPSGNQANRLWLKRYGQRSVPSPGPTAGSCSHPGSGRSSPEPPDRIGSGY